MLQILSEFYRLGGSTDIPELFLINNYIRQIKETAIRQSFHKSIFFGCNLSRIWTITICGQSSDGLTRCISGILRQTWRQDNVPPV